MIGFVAGFRVSRMPLLGVSLATLLVPFQAAAHSGHGHHFGGHRGHHSGTHVGLHFGRSHHGHRGHHGRHHGGVSFAWHGPLYVTPRHRAVYAVRPAVVEHSTRRTRRLPDMPSFEYMPQKGQHAGQLTLDRQRCERQAWRSTRSNRAAGTVRIARSVRYVESRRYPGSPLPRAANGALLGAIGGAIGGDAGLGAAIGAAVGAASWLIDGAHATTVRVPQEVVHREYVPAPGPDPAALGATLTACMEARGYEVR